MASRNPTLAKALGRVPRSLSEPTWQQIPKVMLQLLVRIAETERRLAAQSDPPAAASSAAPRTPDDSTP